MEWTTSITDSLARRDAWGYGASSPPASEPTALVTLALLAASRHESAMRGLEWLASRQSEDGSVGVTATQATPCWPTSLAVIAWSHFARLTRDDAFRDSIVKGRRWLISEKGHTQPQPKNIGHDTTLLGWPWAGHTHAWLEPTAFALLALKLSGMRAHPRAREAVRLLLDRQLPAGGCNYGNTIVMGQTLRAHAQPTGLALLALAGERPDPRVAKSVAYLKRVWPEIAGTHSRCFAAMGLAAARETPADLTSRLKFALESTSPANSYGLALILLASLREQCPLLFGEEPYRA